MNIFFWQHKHKSKNSPRNPILNQAILTLLLISSLFMFAFAMFSPIYAIFVEEIGGDVSTAANSYAIFWVVAGVLTLIAGRLESKMRETELAIVWSQLIIGVAFVLYYFTRSITMLYVVQIILGIGEAFYWPAFHAIYGKHVDGGSESTTQWGIYDGFAYIVPAVAAALGGWLAEAHGFGILFIIMAAISFINGLFILILPRKLL